MADVTLLPVRPARRAPAPSIPVNARTCERLRDVASDWLFEQLSPDGKLKLLREHELLAA